MNARECQKIIKNVLLPCLPNFRPSSMGGGSLVMWPVEHLWRGFAFEYSRTSRACYFSANVIPLCIKTDRYLMRVIGHRLAGGKLFDFSPDAYEASAVSLRKAVLEEGVPFLNEYSSPEDIIKKYLPFGDSERQETLAYIHTFVGNYEIAIPQIENVIGVYERPEIAMHRSKEDMERLAQHRTLLHLLRSEPEKALQLVLELKAETIANYKLNEIE